jgi:translation initiation factor IF-3
VERFLRHKDKVKITIMFRGREVTHPERGVAILDRLAGELSELGVVEQRPLQEGRNMTMMMAPSKAVLAGRVDLGAASNGEVSDIAHIGDVASAAIELPAPVPEEPPAEDGGGDSADTAVS